MSLEDGIVARLIETAKEWLYPGAEELPRAWRDMDVFWGPVFGKQYLSALHQSPSIVP